MGAGPAGRQLKTARGSRFLSRAFLSAGPRREGRLPGRNDRHKRFGPPLVEIRGDPPLRRAASDRSARRRSIGDLPRAGHGEIGDPFHPPARRENTEGAGPFLSPAEHEELGRLFRGGGYGRRGLVCRRRGDAGHCHGSDAPAAENSSRDLKRPSLLQFRAGLLRVRRRVQTAAAAEDPGVH